MKDNECKLSIITITRNNANGLSTTLKSVFEQKDILPHQFEYIIIDGKSTDNSTDVIQSYISQNPNIITFWSSEKDSGIYNAMNKGIKKATGKYCLFLNSGDYLAAPTTLSKLFIELSSIEGDILYSDLYSSDNRLCIKYPDSIDVSFFLQDSINHQNSLIKRILFDKIGLYDESYKIVSDVKFFAQCAMAKKTFIHIKTPIAIYDSTGGISATVPHEDEIVRFSGELFPALKNHFTLFHQYRTSIYAAILRQYGHPKSLDFVLRCYRFIYRIFHRSN